MRRGRRITPTRQVDYHNLTNPFTPQTVFSDDRLEAIHQTSLRVLRDLGMRVLLPEAIKVFAKAGARVVDDMVYLDADMVEATLARAPKSITFRAGTRDKDLTLELGKLVIQPGAGCPHATDALRGRRPGRLEDFRELVQLTQHYDVLHMVPPLVEPQDVPPALRHYAMTQTMLEHSSKVPFVFARGTPQSQQCFEMIRDFRGVSDADFAANSHCYTIINTNSPRTLDIPMAQGIIDFARAGQMSIITPFTLMGAMAPITVAGALMLSHAEALFCIALSQLVRPGAPVCYGTFTSNVDMKSGAPAFGTPEQLKASLGAGQLARRIGLPWRCAAGSAANLSDVQAAHETELSAWGCLLAGSTVLLHGAGWLEGGLTLGYEKLITDIEMLQVMAELCAQTPAEEDDLGYSAVAEVAPQGHFFAAQHTMARYQTAFYDPLVHDFSNIGQWQANGAQDATTRATAIWQEALRAPGPLVDPQRRGDLHDQIAKWTAAGGALPIS